MPASNRPVREINGTSLIRALDVQEVKNLIRLADRGTDIAIAECDQEQKLYALGVLEVLRWFDGETPLSISPSCSTSTYGRRNQYEHCQR
jgi:hypothetical protein